MLSSKSWLARMVGVFEINKPTKLSRRSKRNRDASARAAAISESLKSRALLATLVAGDIAILGINSANPDTFRFTTLKALDAGDVINFTDNGFTGANMTGRTGEGFLTFTTPAGGLPAGSVADLGEWPGHYRDTLEFGCTNKLCIQQFG